LGRATVLVLAAVAALSSWPAAAQTRVAVLTHHYDNARTGWNPNETVLTYNAVGTRFGLFKTVPLDGRPDAQPLVVPNAVVDGDPNAGHHDVVFVVTENNTLYAIDPTSGAVLRQRNFGPNMTIPDCPQPPHVGIEGTPVIDPATNSLYLITYGPNPPNGARYTLHRLTLHDFSDVVAPVEVKATAALSDGSTFGFSGDGQRQRAALLESGGRIYAAFSSFCDGRRKLARGWLLGWRADDLSLTTAELTDRWVTAPHHEFLAGIWMSGSGPAADEAGLIYFATSNSDRGGTSFDAAMDIENSFVAFDPAANRVMGLFTPFNYGEMDRNDRDFGAGGVLLLPRSVPGLPPHLAVAAGKMGMMYLLDRDHLGGFTPGGPDRVVAQRSIGSCYCAMSYFDDGTPKLVSSGGHMLRLWALDTKRDLTQIAASPPVQTGQDPGFLTSVSSDGPAHPVIWAVTRPMSLTDTSVQLLAYAAQPGASGGTLPLLFSAPAGVWDGLGDANLVPVVANGRVYVATDRQLAIFTTNPPPETAVMR
jgi:hypothetical protein